MTTGCADPTFNLSPQAVAMAALLAQTPPSFAEHHPRTGYDIQIETFPWINGRERGIVVTLRIKGQSFCRAVAFGEDRATDGLFVEHWDQTHPFSVPTVEEREKLQAEVHRHQVPFGRLDLAQEHILWTMSEFYAGQKQFNKRPLRLVSGGL